MGADLLSPVHLAFLLVIAVLLFGAKRLPEIGRSLGTGMREFKDSITGAQPSDLPAPAVVEATEVPVPTPTPTPTQETEATVNQ